MRERFGDRLELIATGGIDSPETARRALAAGATACGIFTGFITRGPLLARRILDALASPPENSPQVIHLSTAIHNRGKRTL